MKQIVALIPKQGEVCHFFERGDCVNAFWLDVSFDRGEVMVEGNWDQVAALPGLNLFSDDLTASWSKAFRIELDPSAKVRGADVVYLLPMPVVR
jgi:hypothetical protein